MTARKFAATSSRASGCSPSSASSRPSSPSSAPTSLPGSAVRRTSRAKPAATCSPSPPARASASSASPDAVSSKAWPIRAPPSSCKPCSSRPTSSATTFSSTALAPSPPLAYLAWRSQPRSATSSSPLSSSPPSPATRAGGHTAPTSALPAPTWLPSAAISASACRLRWRWSWKPGFLPWSASSSVAPMKSTPPQTKSRSTTPVSPSWCRWGLPTRSPSAAATPTARATTTRCANARSAA